VVTVVEHSMGGTSAIATIFNERPEATRSNRKSIDHTSLAAPGRTSG
jgi:hypothetical protein